MIYVWLKSEVFSQDSVETPPTTSSGATMSGTTSSGATSSGINNNHATSSQESGKDKELTAMQRVLTGLESTLARQMEKRQETAHKVAVLRKNLRKEMHEKECLDAMCNKTSEDVISVKKQIFAALGGCKCEPKK